MNVKKSANNFKQSEQWAARFSEPTVQWAYFSKNTQNRAIVVSNNSGKFQLHAHDFDSSYDRQITKKRNGTLFGSISPDGEYIYYLNDISGDEHGHYVQVPFTGGKIVDMTPELPPYFSYTLASDDANESFCFTAALQNKNKVFIFSQNQRAVSVYTSACSISEPVVSADGEYVCITVSGEKKKGWSECLVISSRSKKIIASRMFRGESTPLVFCDSEGKRTVLVLTKQDAYQRPVFWLISENKIMKTKNTKFHGDVFVLARNEEKNSLLLCDVFQAQHSLYLYNATSNNVTSVGPKNGSFDLFFGAASFQKDDSVLVRWSDFNTPSKYLKISSHHEKKWNEAYVPNKIQPTSYAVKNISTISSDKSPVQAWVILPKKAQKKMRFVIDIHGGPHGVVSDEYAPEIHAWLENGFGYCAVNYRGSIGFGKKFQEKIYGNPGYWEVEDVVAVRNYLVSKKIADPSRIILTGWSWGGYVTLLALGKYPSFWSAGIGAASIADCLMQYEDAPAYFKATDVQHFQGTPKTRRARYIRSSPTSYAQEIQAPVLLVHGKNDVRCPPRQIHYFVSLMRKAKKTINVLWYASGHTGEYTNTPLRIRLLKKIINFAKSHR